MQNEVEIRNLKDGEDFLFAGYIWVKLEEVCGGVFALMKDNMGMGAFNSGKSQRNDWNRSELSLWLNADFFALLSERRKGTAEFNQISQSLTADDGTVGYKQTMNAISLMTDSQYKKWRDIIPRINYPYWLITPDNCDLDSSFVRVVYPDGRLGNRPVFDPDIGIRPLINLKPDTKVAARHSADEPVAESVMSRLKEMKRTAKISIEQGRPVKPEILEELDWAIAAVAERRTFDAIVRQATVVALKKQKETKQQAEAPQPEQKQEAKPLRTVEPGSLWQHFKGGQPAVVITIAEHSETGEKMVVYSSSSGAGNHGPSIYTRPLNMFLSSVNREKYPDAKQEYRSERIS